MYLRGTLTLSLSVLLLAAAPSASARDNFLILVADDLGVDMVGVYSDDLAYGHPGEGASPGPTPRIDALAQQGVLFRNAYANPNCAPTRAQLLSGRHGLRTGIGQPGGAVLDLAETTIAELLSATHRSAAIGKWHVGPNNDADHPIDQGFEYFAGALNGNITDYEDWQKTTNSEGGSPVVVPNHTVYATDDNSAEAIAKIAEFGDDPWLVYLAFTAPHGPYHVPTPPLTTSVNAGSSNLEKYKAAVEAMDREIGDVLDSIAPSVLADTTIIFIGDNGTPGNVSPGPAKGTVYEGGMNVPLIVAGPHASGAAGQESLALVQASDLFATLADIAAVGSEAEDSLSILPYLEDPSRTTNPARPYQYGEKFSPNGFGPYTEHERGLREDRYKLIWRDGVYEEFFDLVDDPPEAANLLPYDGMTEEQQAAYDRLVQRMRGIDEEGEAACPTRTDVGCSTGFLKARIDWREREGASDRVAVTLSKGPALVQVDFGNPVPVNGTAYSACLYDDADVLVAEMRTVRAGDLCRGRECWKTVGGDVPGGKGYKYTDKLFTSSGTRRLRLFGGDVGKSKVKISGRGADLPDRVTGALLGSSAATLQLRGSDATQCVGATMSVLLKQEADRFKASN